MALTSNSSTNLALLVVSASLVFITSVVFAPLFLSHLLRFVHEQNPDVKHIRRLMLVMMCIVPVFSVSSFVILLAPATVYYLEPLRSCYECLVVFSFFRLMVEMLGGDVNAEALICGEPPKKIFGVPPFCCILRPWMKPRQMAPKEFRVMRFLALQVVAVVLICEALAIILHAVDVGKALIPIQAVNSLSTFGALFALFVFWYSTLRLLANHRTSLKFLAIKLGLIFVVIQKFGFTVLIAWKLIRDQPHGSATEQSGQWQSFLVIIEFFFVNFIHVRAFPLNEFDEGIKVADATEAKPLADVPTDSEHSPRTSSVYGSLGSPDDSATYSADQPSRASTRSAPPTNSAGLRTVTIYR